ncbi:MAG: hypothetical protein HFF64_11335 [Oscillospiraceae bacterium]|nr:hypothetical protein [Oscillospiraceae bacterium]
MAEKTISVRTALMPAYYKDFHCIMGACQDNCCDDGWKIEFSKKDYLTVKRAAQSEELKTMVKQGMYRLREQEHDGMYAEFRINEAGRCAFHTAEGLCALQVECGAEVLPQVCRQYPRHIFYTAAAKEYSLVPSCEGVLALLWDLPGGIDFIEEPLHPSEVRYAHPRSSAEARFASIRAVCIDALQTRTLKLPQRLLLLGLLLQQLRETDWTCADAVDAWALRAEALLQDPSIPAELDAFPQNKRMFLLNNYKVLSLIKEGVGERQVSLFQDLQTSFFPSAPDEESGQVSFRMGGYRLLEEKLAELLDPSDYFFENLMVSVAFYLHVPDLSNPEDMWKSYVNLCNLYSFFRFAAVCAMEKEVSRARLFHILGVSSRSLLHNHARQDLLRDEFFENDSATLAHMAILLGG